MRRVSSLAALVTLLVTAPAASQVCTGFASFEGRPMQLNGSGVFNDNAKSFGGGVAFGGAGAFGQLELGSVHLDVFDASSFVVGGSAGYQILLNKERTVQLCPVAGLGFGIGPKDIGASGVDYSETDITVGIGVGVVATRTQQVQVVPTASLSFANGNGKLKDASGASVSTSESFGLVGLGLGFVFSERVTLKPAVSIPFGVDGASTSFGVTVALNLGTR